MMLYKRVCDSFQFQYRHLSQMIDDAEAKSLQHQKNEYQVRSTLQTRRTKLHQLVRENLEQPIITNNTNSTNDTTLPLTKKF